MKGYVVVAVDHLTPMDGAGKTNSFTTKADGTASITVTLPSMPTRDNTVLVIYNNGGKPPGMERGRIGIDAHHQIIARPE